MKQIIKTLAIVGAIVTVMAFVNADKKSEGAIGDVKYSVLPPEKFKEVNGDGWVLMDDKVPIAGSDLDTEQRGIQIPDARGLFIRSLNCNRKDDKVDAFKAENNKERLMGDYQSDAVGKHEHSLNMRTAYMPDIGDWQHAPKETFIYVADRPAYNNSYGGLTAISDKLPITETRPKNIALYTYIKINE